MSKPKVRIRLVSADGLIKRLPGDGYTNLSSMPRFIDRTCSYSMDFFSNQDTRINASRCYELKETIRIGNCFVVQYREVES